MKRQWKGQWTSTSSRRKVKTRNQGGFSIRSTVVVALVETWFTSKNMHRSCFPEEPNTKADKIQTWVFNSNYILSDDFRCDYKNQRGRKSLIPQWSCLIKWNPPQLLIESLLLLYSFAAENVHALDEPASAESEVSPVSVSSRPKSSSLLNAFFHQACSFTVWSSTCGARPAGRSPGRPSADGPAGAAVRMQTSENYA